MKKRHIFSLLLCVSLFFCFFTIPVKAENSIYLYIDSGEAVYTGFSYNSYKQYVSRYRNPHIYFTYIFSSSNYNDPYFVIFSDSDGNVQVGSSSGMISKSMTYDSDTQLYYCIVNNSGLRFSKTDNASNYVVNENVNQLTNVERFHYVLSIENPYEVVVPTNWGNVADVNISTIYSGNVTNSPTNIDKFKWNNEYTTTGMSIISNLLDHPVVQIQAVPVTWKTSTREEMENQTGADATIGNGVVLESSNARTGHLEVTWQEVIDYLQIEYANIYSYFFDGEYWIMKGWFYQIRLVADGYEGEWITLSNGLNLSPKKSKKLIEDPYDETIYNLLKEISETNGQTTTVYEYGDNNYITINNDPSSGWQDPDGGGSFWDFLASVVKAISDGIASIVSSVASLVGDLVNGILGLFTFDTFEINNYNTEVQTLKDNSGIFGQSIEFADSIKDSIRGVERQPAVLHFDGIVIDNVQLIPAIDLDFDQMVVDAGLTDFHNLVYVFTDGTILISLIIMVHHKLMEVLRK